LKNISQTKQLFNLYRAISSGGLRRQSALIDYFGEQLLKVKSIDGLFKNPQSEILRCGGLFIQ
jgi:hypothetical protein